jgi:lipoate-protein ligase A
MACDHMLAERVGRGDAAPVLRLYAWHPPAVSVGYNQSLREVAHRIPELTRQGIDVVRRPTGGAAVFHSNEVTYSVAASRAGGLLAGGPRAACGRIHAAIRAGLQSLGIAELTLHEPARTPRPGAAAAPSGTGASGRPTSEACFASASRSEVAWRGRKLVGSAQRRLGGALLQHGSILLDGDQSALGALWPRADRVGAMTLAAAGGRGFDWQETAEAVIEGFEGERAASFQEETLDPGELRRIAELERELYGDGDFLFRL